MPTSKEESRSWLQQAIKVGATHVLIVCDTFAYEDYPIVVGPESNVREIGKSYDGVNMQKIMEVYNLSLPIEPQLDETRAMNWGVEPAPISAPITETEQRYEEVKNLIYMGDGLFASYDGYQIELCAHNGMTKTNVVYLDPGTLKSFIEYIKTLPIGKVIGIG